MKYPHIDRIVQHTFRRVGKDDLWRRYTGGSYETAETVGDYKVEFDRQENGDVQFIVRNPTSPCISMYVHKDEAVLSFLEYSPRCTVDGKMKRGQGTRDMLNFAFDLAKKLGAKTVQLSDQSTIQCETGEIIKLGPYSFFKYGKTWYEKHFGFYPTAEYQEEYEHAKTLRKKFDMPCAMFDRKHMNALLREVELDFFGIVWEKTL